MNEEQKFVRAVIRTALLIGAANHQSLAASGIRRLAAEWEKWVWGEEDGSTGNQN